MDMATRRYLITAYSEWEVLDVETQCPDDDNAMEKARRYGSLKYVGKNYPPVIFAHVACDEEETLRDVGTWEYQIRDVKKSGFIWHAGTWPDRPMAEDQAAIRQWSANFANGR
ncbi:hypothetical protein [Sphingobium yanoikuyae]|uniref:hypothetical protein n=1 Tax=Sphingobium yanoikuyae TaxID=13690 RepID=UPI0012376143|nr:hypothetical protein [Sphingobium yanoikuyae]